MSVRVDFGKRLVRTLVLGSNGKDNSDDLWQGSRLGKPS